jgi:hypothetical protein
VIALQGSPCGEVVEVRVQAENDFAASCKDENRYRVCLNAEGRGASRSSVNQAIWRGCLSRWHHADVDDQVRLV